MKCPKCGYLGFETIDRCRNCGYDFSLSAHVESPLELTLQRGDDGPGAPLADFDLGTLNPQRDTDTGHGLDLDRLIGTRRATPELASAKYEQPPGAAADLEARRKADAAAVAVLPLFSSGPSPMDDDAPLITTPRPVRPPLSVRRTTPDLTRGRRVRSERVEEPALALQPESPAEPEAPATAAVRARPADIGVEAASGAARIVAAIVDLLLLAAIDAAVIYLTLAIVGLTPAESGVLPRVPLAAFLVLLNGGYLVMFVAASGRTIGKMIAGIQVIGDDGRRVDVAGAVLRAGGCTLSVLTLGLGYLPAFFAADGRALQDRIAGTKVIRNLH